MGGAAWGWLAWLLLAPRGICLQASLSYPLLAPAGPCWPLLALLLFLSTSLHPQLTPAPPSLAPSRLLTQSYEATVALAADMGRAARGCVDLAPLADNLSRGGAVEGAAGACWNCWEAGALLVIINLERVGFHLMNFDMAAVFKVGWPRAFAAGPLGELTAGS